MIYHCCQENRRTAVAEHPTLNGIDYIEVLDKDAPAGSPRQQTLLLFLLKPVPNSWTIENIHIEGGERIKNPKISWIAIANNLTNPPLTNQEINFFSAYANPENLLLIRTESRGDFSQYCLRLQENAEDPESIPTGFDPRLSSVNFSFKVECPSQFDCKPVNHCEGEKATDPDINYLARDYASFRKLIIDRMSVLLPDWQARSPADLGVVLAEMVAYVGDKLSYWQDAVATEAYIRTARKRISLRRHALLVDYRISEGRNARAWLHVNVNGGGPFTLASDNQFLTSADNLRTPQDFIIADGSRKYEEAKQQGALVYELLRNETLHEDHNEIQFYTWGDNKCCLPKGATRATLSGHYPELITSLNTQGQYLLFEEVVGPHTNKIEDADPTHRQMVMLTKVVLTEDPLDATPITEIQWKVEDALQFPLCISSETSGDADSSELLSNVSVARGNMVLVDHGESISEDLGAVPNAWLFYPEDKESDRCSTKPAKAIPPRFSPVLGYFPLSYGAAAPEPGLQAADVLQPSMQNIEPLVKELLGTQNDGVDQSWKVKPDLLNSDENDSDFVVEIDNVGRAHLRFGDDKNGMRPNAETAFSIQYRVGNGVNGNVGAEAIKHIVTADNRIAFVRNPLPAKGGVEAESLEQIRRRAPQAFRTQLRAVTSEDYAHFTSEQEGVQNAAATPRWTGSWYTQTITVDREQGLALDESFVKQLAANIERYRMAGHDLGFNEPIFVSLRLDLQICVSRDFFRSDVEAAILNKFNSGFQANGQPGLFHSDNFSFGQTLYLSPFIAAARAVAGVSSVKVTHFSKQGETDLKALTDGFIKFGRLEIARLDNNPNFPENGVLNLSLLGGK